MRVVIPARRASRTLRPCVRALMQSSTTDPLEIVIVDDGDNCDLREELASYPVRVLATQPSGSAAVARNRGAADFTGDILVFVDADVEVESRAIATLTRPIRDGIADATVGAYTAECTGMSFLQRYKTLYLSVVYSGKDRYIRNHFWTALSAIKVSSFTEVGGFRRFPAAHCEDVDLGQRLTAIGKLIMSVPGARGVHRKRLNLRQLFLNDLIKGRKSVALSLVNRTPLCDNRHCSSRDMAAVFCAAGLLIHLLLLPVLNLPAIVAGLPFSLLAGGYLLARRRIVSAFRGHGFGFLVGATFMQFFLDVIRIFCFGLGAVDAILARFGKSRMMLPRDPGSQGRDC
jgi:glycosyltransferase involved in cell wall biosynthesis